MNLSGTFMRSIWACRLPMIVAAVVAMAGNERVAADLIVPVESRVETSGQAGLNYFGDVNSQGAILSPLSSFTSGAGTNGYGGSASVQGGNSIVWTNAASGTASFQNLAIQATNESGSDIGATYYSSLRYSFQGTEGPGHLTINYQTSGNSPGSYGFIIQPYVLMGTFTSYLDAVEVTDGASGTYEYWFNTLAISDGIDGYGFEIYKQTAVTFGNGFFAYSLNGTFDFTVAATAVPEPSSVLLMGVAGAVGWVVRSRRAAVRGKGRKDEWGSDQPSHEGPGNAGR